MPNIDYSFLPVQNEEKDKFDSQNKKIKTVIESDFRKLLGVIG